ncbi:MAG TPA: RNA polymerase sigma factor SigJ, partial [Ktedonobacterales bacterium]|nr:RNA polymerase sigma factor SigJ [Ktedonobacterales bacterium]
MDEFEAHRGLMFSIAYRMLGSVADAEDILQEAYLRYRDVPAGSIASPRAFLSTMVTRLCLNQLQSARARREAYIGPWLPEPVITAEQDAFSQVALEESISMAFLVLLERLTPVERAVFLLREAFDYSYAEIAEMVGKEEATCRQIFSRAKKFLASQRPRFSPSREQHHLILRRFMQAVGSGNLDELIQLLAADVALWADGGGRGRGAATRVVHGPNAVARFVLGSIRLLQGPYEAEFTEVNREPAVILRVNGTPV